MIKVLLAAGAVLMIGLSAVSAQDYRGDRREDRERREHRNYCEALAQNIASSRTNHMNRREREEIAAAQAKYNRECRR